MTVDRQFVYLIWQSVILLSRHAPSPAARWNVESLAGKSFNYLMSWILMSCHCLSSVWQWVIDMESQLHWVIDMESQLQWVIDMESHLQPLRSSRCRRWRRSWSCREIVAGWARSSATGRTCTTAAPRRGTACRSAARATCRVSRWCPPPTNIGWWGARESRMTPGAPRQREAGHIRVRAHFVKLRI